MLTEDGVIRIQTPRVFLPLLEHARYKGIEGGRGGGKSHFVAERLIEEMLSEHIRLACCREVMNTIKDSSKQLLEDKIDALGVGRMFDITEREIRGPNDSLVIFRGLQNHTVTSMKSLEGFNRFWADEAQTISKKSLEIATPTFRADGTELYFTWNPKEKTDPVDVFFHENENDPDVILVRANYHDNPFFPEALRKDMERDKRRDPDKYAHVWLGKYEQNSEARVFKNWTVESFETPDSVQFDFGADWGFAVDPTVLIRSFIIGRKLFVDMEAYKVGCEIDNTPALFETIPGSKQWVIRADSARPETISYMQRHGFPKITRSLKGPGSVMDGIEFLKSYDIIVHPRCKHTIDELTMYKFKVDKLTGDVLPELEDKKNHVIDALRYSHEGRRRASKKQAPVGPRSIPIFSR